MTPEERLEARLRTLKLESYDSEAARIDAAELASIKLFRQTHETVDGKRVKLTKRRKISKHAEIIDRIFSDDIDISTDAINMVRALDA